MSESETSESPSDGDETTEDTQAAAGSIATDTGDRAESSGVDVSVATDTLDPAADGGVVNPVTLQPLVAADPGAETHSLELLAEVDIELTVRVGTAHVPLKTLLELGRGSLLVLDRRAGDAVDILANGTLVAHGELVTVDDSYGVRVSAIVTSKRVPQG